MKKTKIITMSLLLATLAVGCSKDEATIVTNNEPTTVQGKSPLRLFVNNLENNGSKVLINPSNPLEAANWIEGELVKLNGTVYSIKTFKESDETYYGLYNSATNEFVQPLNANMWALYPGETFDDNEVEINGTKIILHNLGIHFLAGGKQSMAFPLVASAVADSRNLKFDHLSGGVQVTLHNQSGSEKQVATLRIVAQSESAVVNLGKGDTIACWAVEGPWLPFGLVGTNDDNIDVKYSSAMYFTLHDDVNSTAFKTIANNDDLTLCVPITINSMKKLNVTGYAADGTQLFQVHKTFANSVQVERNRMYTLPQINIQ